MRRALVALALTCACWTGQAAPRSIAGVASQPGSQAALQSPGREATAASVRDMVPATRVFMAGRVFPVSSGPIDEGAVVVSGGRITAVGRASELSIPPSAEIVREPRAWLVPGFVDLHAHVGGTDLNDMVLPINPDLDVLDQVVPGNESLLDAQSGGVTTMLFIPGSGTNLSGFGVLMKTAGDTLASVLVRNPGAMKIAQAGNPERYSGELGLGRLGMNWNIREALREGRDYDRAWTAFESGATQVRPKHVQRLEPMRAIMQRKIPVLVHTQWFPVFQSTIRMLHDEFGLWVVLSHAEFDSYKNAPLVAERGMFVNAGPRAYNQDYETGMIHGLAAWYHEQGVEHLSVNTDCPVVPPEELPYQATMGVRLGLPWDIALRALTLEPALAIGMGDRLGSLEAGKEADFSLWSGDPLDPRSHVLLTVVGGRIALDQRDPAQRRF